MWVAALFVAVVAVLVAVSATRRRRRLRFIERYEFPAPLAAKLREHHPQLLEEDAQLALAALREWFVACHHARGKMIGMPSRVADDAWHEFILMTRLYHAFCERAFGKYLHHTPSAVATTPPAEAIPRTLELLERGSRDADRELPTLFTVDSRLGIERGRTWTRGRVALVASVGTDASGGDGCSGGDGGGDGCSGGDGCGCGGCCG